MGIKKNTRPAVKAAKAPVTATPIKHHSPKFGDKTLPLPEYGMEANGKLTKLGKGDFPNTKDGKVKYYGYQIAKLEVRRDKEIAKGDPKTKLQNKLEKKRAELAAIEKELAGMESPVS